MTYADLIFYGNIFFGGVAHVQRGTYIINGKAD